MSRRKVLPIRATAFLTEVGGAVDESSATLAVYGEDLEPNDVTTLLGVEPTAAFRKGYRRGPRSPATVHGAWFLEVRGSAPAGPDVQLESLLSKLPDSEHVWRELNERYTVQVRFALHLESWNRGFDLNNKLLSRLAAMESPLMFDIYGYGAGDV